MPSQSSSNKSGNILNFFRPVTRPQPQPQTPPRASRSAVPASPSPLPPSSPLSLRTTPARPAATEIAASDDDSNDGGSSDDSLEDLSALLGRRGRPMTDVPSQQKPQHNPFATPRAKRTAVAFHASPLAIMPKHKFDMKALAKDARRDDATTASSMRAKTAAEEAKQNATSTSNEASGDAVLEIVKESGGHDAEKVLRAVQRSEPGQSQLRYCFFDAEYSVPTSKPATKEGKKGPWSLLTQGSTKVREQHLASGVPQTILRKMNNLPDSLLEWILDELCTQKSVIMRQEYCNMIADCPEQVERLLTPERLQELFIRLGAGEDLKNEGSDLLTLSKLGHEPYQDRDWACLLSFLSLLGSISRQMSVPAVEYAIQTLLRMSMDRFLLCNIDVLVEYEGAIQHLADAIPTTSWDLFCLKTCLSLYTGIKPQTIRANALLCLPTSNRRTHDLRRRLAVVFLFNDTALARHSPEDVVTIAGMTDLLSGRAFAINLKTDFAELKASIILLDIAVDDGSVVASFDDGKDEKAFNDDVDELAAKLREIWRKINDSGMKLARTEAKSVVEWVQQRLSNTVRTRRKPKKSVFDLPGEAEDPFLPRQQDHMKKFMQKQPKSPAVEEHGCIGAASE
ncbi:Uncharacterized protein TCAP_03372 [Tolypocladium capitatum]|uniref:Uncharacterized protein n=1 Tax=Tolypocladium capitatum TaxID=45235 RepID=A0A2K3QGL5_9HYPO|nr:Uncharacterized protein TCAP_03372 [Tolypocladium capitatum]